MLVLLALLMALPWAQHILRLDAALDRIRYAEQWGGLIPAHALVLKWTAYLSGNCAVILVGLFALSWKYPVLVSGRVLGRLATAACAFVVLYSLLCGWNLGIVLQRCGRTTF
jgi:hypothetical protein